MKLKFSRIDIHSFMSFADETFDFSEHTGLSLIQGRNNDIASGNERNGAGKSNIGNALLYVLFGELQDMKKNEHIVNRYASDKDMRLSLRFSVDDSDYVITRGMLKGKNTYLTLASLGKDGVETDITKSTIAETQAFLEKEIIRCDISIFLRTILLTADQTYNFYKLKKADKKDFVEKLFDISVFGDMYQAIHKDILAFDKDINSRQNRIMVLSGNESTYVQKSAEWDEQAKARGVALKEKHRELSESLASAEKTEVSPNSEEAAKYKAAKDKIQEAKRKYETELRKCNSAVSDADTAIRRAELVKESNAKTISSHSDLMSKLCEDCRPVFSEYNNIGVCEKNISNAEKTMAEQRAVKAELLKKRDDISKKIDECDVKFAKAEKKISDLTSEYVKFTRLVSGIRADIASNENEMKRLSESVNPYAGMIDENRKKLETETAAIHDAERKYGYLKFAENIVSQETLRKLIIKDLIVLLNNKVKTYLTKLGAKYYVEFDEDMDYRFVTNGGECEFGNFSAGEKMRTMIATSFAFRDFMSIRNGLNANVLILDEYFDSAISSLCVESILSILKEYNTDYDQNIFVISHRSEVNPDSFDRIIEVQKTNDISSIRILQES